jgi:hypothetical protein
MSAGLLHPNYGRIDAAQRTNALGQEDASVIEARVGFLLEKIS